MRLFPQFLAHLVIWFLGGIPNKGAVSQTKYCYSSN